MKNIFFDFKRLKSMGENVIIGKTVRIRYPELVEIGNNVIIDDFTYISGNISIGNYVHIGASCTLQAGSGIISIGNHCGFASGTRIFAASSDYLNPNYDMPCYPKEMRKGGIISNIIISDYCIFGANSVILPGVEVPEGVAFGANLVVRKKTYISWHLYYDTTLEKKAVRLKHAL